MPIEPPKLFVLGSLSTRFGDFEDDRSATMALGASAASPAVLLKSQYQAYEHHLPMFMTSYLAASRIKFFSKYLMPSREIATAFKMVFGEAAVTLKILLKMLI
ncbi:hypothetical protein BGAL_0356g00020 [Botrytis galanthina]|uniref:Uncharacterized protein n=1 Tax=Botrytis galanthina TaxID=278940 RepID=A0A4S8QP08_9HELO|nr:hypothetical protein BGAL_0356g00020 [Botrytis galanthina]